MQSQKTANPKRSGLGSDKVVGDVHLFNGLFPFLPLLFKLLVELFDFVFLIKRVSEVLLRGTPFVVQLATEAVVVVPGPGRGQVGVVRRGRVGDAPLAPGVQVAQVVGHLLQVVRFETVIVPQKVVTRGSAGPLKL